MSVNSVDVVRPLGAIEELLWLFGHSSPKQFCLVAEVDGSTAIAEWRVALDALQQCHPMLSVSIDSTYSRVPHFVRAEGHPIPLRVAEGDTTWERESEREIRMPFDPTNAPLIRVVLIHKPEKTFVLLVLHHAIGDGAASVFLLRDLLRALSGDRLERQAFPRSLDEIVGVPVRTSSEQGAVLSQELAKMLAQAPVHVESRALSAELTSRIRKLAGRKTPPSTTSSAQPSQWQVEKSTICGATIRSGSFRLSIFAACWGSPTSAWTPFPKR
ncbi:hypothetical protein [Granulicella sp. WH15]|uniref:hypothetical protein n=1 Tax=Granulicella sp. WH15 TaxID=2602070 RepID=UPI0013A59974|nr:hypothetical protein [Granulicella sp. WH15]